MSDFILTIAHIGRCNLKEDEKKRKFWQDYLQSYEKLSWAAADQMHSINWPWAGLSTFIKAGVLALCWSGVFRCVVIQCHSLPWHWGPSIFIPASDSTMLREIIKRKPFPSKKNMAALVTCRFVKSHVNKTEDFWISVLWSDETKVEIFGHSAQNTAQLSCTVVVGG